MKVAGPDITGTAQAAIVAAIKNTDDATKATLKLVTELLSSSVIDASIGGASVTAAIGNIVSGAIRGTLEVGANVGHAAKGIIIGVLHGTQDTGTPVLDTIRHTAYVVIRDTASLGGDVGGAALGLVAGVIEATKKLGISAEGAAHVAVDGALKAASHVSSITVETVRRAVTRPLNAMKTTIHQEENNYSRK